MSSNYGAQVCNYLEFAGLSASHSPSRTPAEYDEQFQNAQHSMNNALAKVMRKASDQLMPSALIDHVQHGTGNLEGFNAAGLIKNASSTINPCPKHPLNEISYLDKTSKQGACEICLPTMLRANHEMLPIKQTVDEVKQVLVTLDMQINEIQQRKRF